MKNILTLSILLVILVSCKTKDKKEKEIYDFLNHTANKFDKSKYELVNLNLYDTVYVTDYHSIKMTNSFIEYSEDETPVTVDTTASNYNADFYKDMDWLYQPFSRKLHEYIREDNVNYTDFNSTPNIFLNAIVNESYSDFRQKFIYENKFQKKLVEELSAYEKFKNLKSRDSIYKYIDIEKKKDKEIFGFIYYGLYRINNELYKMKFFFDKNEKLIEYEEL
ncbi:hypothetical protein [Pedobacter mendelii]|nr:hypothetical protein [Pedobacter mendelii]